MKPFIATAILSLTAVLSACNAANPPTTTMPASGGYSMGPGMMNHYGMGSGMMNRYGMGPGMMGNYGGSVAPGNTNTAPARPFVPQPTATAAAAPNGAQVFQTSCAACHTTGMLNAPRIGDKSAWKPRIAKGMPTLLHSASNGLGTMPARGGNPSLTNAELKAAVTYMVSQSS